MGKVLDTTDIRPPTKIKRKRKVRSDKGVKRTEPKEVKSKITTQPSKYLFDEHVINGQWWIQVKDNLVSRSNNDLFVMELMINGVRYTNKNYFADPTIAYTMGVMFLEHRYKNRSMYQ